MALTLGVILVVFVAMKWWSDTNNRVPAQFSKQELQYAEFLWGDEKEGVKPPEDSYPSVQPQWGDEVGSHEPYSYSNPVEEDLQKQIQKEYHHRLHEEWKRRKEKAAKAAARKENNSTSGGAASPSSDNSTKKAPAESPSKKEPVTL